jgi:hypothetical protein
MADEIFEVSNTHDCKWAGLDKLQSFWITLFSVMNADLTTTVNATVKDPKNISMWLTSGITFLLSKGKDMKDPKNYCLITCLLAICKIDMTALKTLLGTTFSQKNGTAVTECLADIKTSCW